MSNQRGFTFFEILVTTGIFIVVGGLALLVSMETFRGSSFRSDRDLLVSALQHARAQAMNNICFGTCIGNDGQPHGVHIQSDKYVIFQGNAYDSSDPNNAAFDSTITTTKTPATLDILFSQLSGNSAPATVTLTDAAGHASAVSVSVEGQISWTN